MGSKQLPKTPRETKIGRNESCPCGSGIKYKKCCMLKERSKMSNSSEPSGIKNKMKQLIGKAAEKAELPPMEK